MRLVHLAERTLFSRCTPIAGFSLNNASLLTDDYHHHRKHNTMPAPGHRPVSSDAPQPETRRVLEAAAPQKNRVSLPYYRPPPLRKRVVNESAVLNEDAADLNVALPDVAIASFGEPRLLEAIIGVDDRV